MEMARVSRMKIANQWLRVTIVIISLKRKENFKISLIQTIISK